jgi:hypothetical protein
MAELDDSMAEQNLGGIQLWTLDGEATIRVWSGRIEPYLLLGFGYTTVGGLDDAVQGLHQGLDVDGANARMGVGLNLRLTPTFSLDGRLAGELLAVSRRGVPVRDLAEPMEVGTLNEARARILQGDGSSLGTAVSLTVGPAVQF